jgi:hypothetical protein
MMYRGLQKNKFAFPRPSMPRVCEIRESQGRAHYVKFLPPGHIGIVDYNEVKLNNLHRQLLHPETSTGQPKVFSAVESLKRCVFSFVRYIKIIYGEIVDRLCGLVVRVLGYRSGGPGFDSRHYKKKV